MTERTTKQQMDGLEAQLISERANAFIELIRCLDEATIVQ